MPELKVNILDKLISSATGNATIFHYTSQEGLLGIITSKSLWVSSIRHLSDSTEFAYAVDLARTTLEARLQGANDHLRKYYEDVAAKLDVIKDIALFVGSFSEDGDLLSQWRAYTPNGVGFSLGFEYELLKRLAEQQHFTIMRCVYRESEHSAILGELIDQAAKLVKGDDTEKAVEEFVISIFKFAPALKHPSFSEEKEWRLISPVFIFDEDASMKFRPGRSMLIPFREFRLVEADETLTVSKIFIGPAPHAELSTSSVRYLLTTSQVSPCPIVPSCVPYRTW